MGKTTNLSDQPEKTRVAFYGALFAIAAVDGVFAKDEMTRIFESLELDGLSEESRRTVYDYVINPPQLEPCLVALKNTSDEIRFGLMINLVEIVDSDDYVDDQELEYVDKAKVALGVSTQQLEEIKKFVKEARRIRERGIDDNVAADAMKRAAAGLAGVGIPIAAVYFSGAVVGLSAAGITSGLAALGLGFGMVPGIGTAILVGTVIAIGVSKMLDVGSKRKKGEAAAERERKAQIVIKNLQEAINTIIDQITHLKSAANDAAANREAIELLTQRLKALQQSLNARKREMGAA